MSVTLMELQHLASALKVRDDSLYEMTFLNLEINGSC